MLRSFLRYTVVLAVLLSPLVAFGAETLKLKYLGAITSDEKEGMLKSPEGVACTDKGLVVVADTGNGRLLRYSYQDKSLKGGTVIKVPELPYPLRLQLDSKGNIYALDGKRRRIVILNPEGAFTGYLEPQEVPAPAIVPRSFKIGSGDHFYLLDIAGARVLVLDPAGKYLRQIPFPANQGFFSDLAVNANGDVLLLDSINAMVYTAGKDASAFAPLTPGMRDYMNFSTYLTTDSRGIMYLVDQDGGAIIVIGPDGTFQGRQLDLGWKPGLLYYPAQLCLNGAGEFFIADRNNSKVQIFEAVKLAK